MEYDWLFRVLFYVIEDRDKNSNGKRFRHLQMLNIKDDELNLKEVSNNFLFLQLYVTRGMAVAIRNNDD